MTNNTTKTAQLSDLCTAAAAEFGELTVNIIGYGESEEGKLTLVEHEGYEIIILDPKDSYDAAYVGESEDAFHQYRELISE